MNRLARQIDWIRNETGGSEVWLGAITAGEERTRCVVPQGPMPAPVCAQHMIIFEPKRLDIAGMTKLEQCVLGLHNGDLERSRS